MASDKRVVITGIGPLASTGIGKDAFWDGILKKSCGLKLEDIDIDGEAWDKFYLHKIDDFGIEKFNIEEEIIEDIRTWKKGREDKDLFYLLAAIKLALDDSGLLHFPVIFPDDPISDENRSGNGCIGEAVQGR